MRVMSKSKMRKRYFKLKRKEERKIARDFKRIEKQQYVDFIKN